MLTFFIYMYIVINRSRIYRPTLTPWGQVSYILVKNFNVVLAHTCGSHNLMKHLKYYILQPLFAHLSKLFHKLNQWKMSSFFTAHFPKFSSFQGKNPGDHCTLSFANYILQLGLYSVWNAFGHLWNVLQNQSPARIKTKNMLVVRKNARSKTSTSMC